jgi:hypothetical protein
MSINAQFLKSQNINDTESGYVEKESEKLYIFGIKFDKVSLIVHIIGIILWILIWKISGLFSVNCSILLIFFFFVIILMCIFVWLQKDEKIAYISQEEFFAKANRERSLVIFGSTILLLIVLLYKNNFIIDNNNITDFMIIAIANSLILLSLISYQIPNRADKFRTVRTINGMLYNNACFLIIAYFIKLYCSKQ